MYLFLYIYIYMYVYKYMYICIYASDALDIYNRVTPPPASDRNGNNLKRFNHFCLNAKARIWP